jgi:hypothetical protein
LRYRIPVKRDAIRDAGLKELGAHARLKAIAFEKNGRARAYPERCRLLTEYKAELKSEHRKIALECHPDRNMDASDDDRKVKEDRFKRITRAVNFLMGIESSHPRPAPRVPTMRPMPQRQGFVMVVNMGQGGMGLHDMRFGSTSANATTPSTGSQNYWPWHG